MMFEKLRLLGMSAKDKVTGFNGVITAISFGVEGACQVFITESIKYSTRREWFVLEQIQIGPERILPAPDFAGDPQ